MSSQPDFRLKDPKSSSKGRMRAGRPTSKLGIPLFLILLFSSVAQGFLEEGFSRVAFSALLAVLLPAILFAVVFFLVRQKRTQSRGSLAGGAEAGHLCESHNGVPTKRGRKTAAPKYAASGELRRKTEEINDLYAAGIIDGAERAERLAALR